MLSLRAVLAVLLSTFLPFFVCPPTQAANLPLGILTLADHAHLDEAQAFAGLSVFEGEKLSTDGQGRLGVRAGHSTLALGARTEAELFKISDGVHVDLSAGSVFFSAAVNERVEVHVAEAILKPDSDRPTQASVTMLAPKVLQISARRGGLNFSYHQEFRNLPEGETYRIYLDAPAEPQDVAGVAAGKAGIASKVVYFIVGLGVGGGTAWGIRAASFSGNSPESPAKP